MENECFLEDHCLICKEAIRAMPGDSFMDVDGDVMHRNCWLAWFKPTVGTERKS